ncbi:Adenylosuccinate synthetase [uncultured archaeon]|nr:Adenylosuccinate synthetase [uncultured archaeon]
MAVDEVIGAQIGDEGKGLICEFLGLKGDYSMAIRSASPQAGHSIHFNGRRVALAHLPCAVVNPELRVLLGGASFIDPRRILYGGKDIRPHTGEEVIFEGEITTFGLTPDRLGIDYNAKLVTPEHIARERASSLMGLGSIGSGVNPAKHDLIDKKATFAREDDGLKYYITDTVKEMNDALVCGENILFETDHGIELCQHFGGRFPYNTARTINSSAYLGEIGLPPQVVRDVYLVLKPYSTAVAPKSPLENEIRDEKTLAELLHTGGESGSMSGRIRRAAKFDSERFKRAVMLSGATRLAVTHLDLSSHAWNTIGFSGDQEFLSYLNDVANKTYQKPKLSIVSYGPKIEDVRQLRSSW